MALYKKHLYIIIACVLTAYISSLKASQPGASIITRYSLPLIGDAAYPDNFKHFDYVNPNAPKGGNLKLAALGSYDTLNQYNAKGRPAEGLYMTYDRLMVRSADEPYTLYPLLAKNIEYPENYEWVAFNLDPRAQFHDGRAITSADVVFTFNTLKESGSPFIKNNYRDVLSAKVESPHRVVFKLGDGRGIKLLAYLAFIPILPMHFWQNRSFDAGLTQLPLGSGPMKISKVQLGHSITFERVKNYWGADLPVYRGMYNFDHVTIDYYRDSHAAMEAFRAGLYDFRYEFDSRSWHQNYHFPAVKKRQVIIETAPFLHPPGMKAFVFNTRKPLFKSRQVRQALLQLFDFEWTNKHLLHSDYTRTTSFFANTPLEARGLPSQGELALLEPFRKELPPELFSHAPSLPTSDGAGNSRKNKQQAIQLLQKAGWVLNKGQMIQQDSSKPMVFNMLLESAKDERVVTPFKKSLSDIGIKMNIQTLDISQYRKRIKEFDFDMASWHFIHSPFPGSEQANSWSGLAANEPRSNNLAGVNNLTIDRLVNRLREADNYQDIVDVTKTLDRLLLWGYYVIPKWHSNQIHMAYWQQLKRPHTGNPQYPVLEAMWYQNSSKY